MVYQQNKKEEKKNLQWRRRREHNEDEDGVRANEVYLLTINEVKLRMYKSWHEKSSSDRWCNDHTSQQRSGQKEWNWGEITNEWIMLYGLCWFGKYLKKNKEKKKVKKCYKKRPL